MSTPQTFIKKWKSPKSADKAFDKAQSFTGQPYALYFSEAGGSAACYCSYCGFLFLESALDATAMIRYHLLPHLVYQFGTNIPEEKKHDITSFYENIKGEDLLLHKQIVSIVNLCDKILTSDECSEADINTIRKKMGAAFKDKSVEHTIISIGDISEVILDPALTKFMKSFDSSSEILESEVYINARNLAKTGTLDLADKKTKALLREYATLLEFF